jgi:hypothetical protein
MPSLETYLEHANGCAQSIMNQWQQIHWAGNAALMTEEFLAVHDLAFRFYLATKQREQLEKLNVRLKGQLYEELAEDLAQVQEDLAQAQAYEALRQRAFVEAYKAAEERPRRPRVQ